MKALYLLLVAVIVIGMIVYISMSWVDDHLEAKARLIFKEACTEYKYTGVFYSKYNNLLPADFSIENLSNQLVLKKNTNIIDSC